MYNTAVGFSHSSATSTLIKENEYSVNRSSRLGRGSFGEVFVGTYHGQDIAVKELLLEHISKDTEKELESEASIMLGLRHGAVVQFLGLGIRARGYAILMEFMPKGSLFQLLHSGQPIALKMLLQIATDISSGLSYLHAQNIVHQNLKSLNVLLGVGYRAKLSDFGMARVKSESASLSSKEGCGSAAWMAPEVAIGESNPSFASDMYSLGMVFWELFARKIPFVGLQPIEIAVQIDVGKKEEIPSNTPVPLREIITQCWGVAGTRPPARDVAQKLSDLYMPISACGGAADAALARTDIPPNTTQAQVPAYEPLAIDISGNTLAPLQSLSLDQELQVDIGAIIATPSHEKPLSPHKGCELQEAQLVTISGTVLSGLCAAPQSNGTASLEISLADIALFLKLVAYGEQEKVYLMLQAKPRLMLCRGNVTDLSARTFKHITALQYAVWALDWQMWLMLSHYIDKDEAIAQITGMAENPWVDLYEVSAEQLIRNLSHELKVYANNHVRWHMANDTASIRLQWCKKVGNAQRQLPVHVVNEYCHPTEDFLSTSDFTSATRYGNTWRNRMTNNGEWFTTKGVKRAVHVSLWRKISGEPDHRLGSTFAFVREERLVRERVLVGCIRDSVTSDLSDYKNFLAIESLLNTRLQQLREWELYPVYTKAKEQRARLVAERQAKEQETRFVAEREAKKAEKRARAILVAKRVVEIAAFLKLVVEGEESKAEVALRAKPELALCAGDITDLSGRTFHNITALQYAIWALDWQMWKMLLANMDREDISNQLDRMATGHWVRTHGSSAEGLIRNLVTELQGYIDNYEAWEKANDYGSMEKQWSVKVGTAQRQLPVHVVNEYCHPREAFDPLPDFKSAIRYQPGWRSREADKVEWFTTSYVGGSSWAAFRSALCSVGIAKFGLRALYASYCDLPAVQKMLVTRLQQRADLIDVYNGTVAGSSRRIMAINIKSKA